MNESAGYSVRMWQRDFGGARVLAVGLAVRVVRLSWAAVGGPLEAELEVSGQPAALGQCAGWLRNVVEVLDMAGDVVWWGFVADVLIGERPGMPAVVGLGLDGMRNRAAVVYEQASLSGSTQRAQTAWAEDLGSVGAYGRREERIVLGAAADAAGAARARDHYVASARYPIPRLELDKPALYQTARVTCKGWWSTLAWQYYAQPVGREGSTRGNYVWDLGAGAGPLAVAQGVLLPVAGEWVADRVAVQLGRCGECTDGVVLSVCADDGGVPGTLLAMASFEPTGPVQWYEAALNVPVLLSGENRLWLVLARGSGVNDPDNAYQVVLDPARSYPRGVLRRWDGATWDVIDPDSTMPFLFSRVEQTSSQLAAILAAAQFVVNVTVAEDSGFATCPYRDGDRLLLDEVLELLHMGASVGQRYACTIGADRVARVTIEAQSNLPLHLLPDGRVWGPKAEPISPWANLAGQWLEVAGCEWLAEVGALGAASPVYVDRCELDLRTGRRTLTPRRPAKPADDLLAGIKPYVGGWISG